jgi:hypothetical protein
LLSSGLGLAIATTALSQPTLTASNSIPTPGTTIGDATHFNFTVPALSTTGSGNNWDMGALSPNGTSTLIQYQDLSASPHASLYPSATLSAYVTGNGAPPRWDHFQSGPSSATYFGADADPYPDPLTGITFPFSIGNSHTDTYQAPGAGSASWQVTYVASGQATTPWGVQPNVVMFSLNGGTSYLFYEASNMLRSIGSYIPGNFLQFDQVEMISGMSEMGIHAMGIWPTPATGSVQLTLASAATGTLEILDATGRSVRAVPIHSARITVDLHGLAKGVYTALADQGGEGRSIGRLVVE